MSTCQSLCRLFAVFQPGGGAERTSLLKSLTEVRVGTTIHIALRTIRLWRSGWPGIGVEGSHSGSLDFDAGSWEDVGCSWKVGGRTSVPTGWHQFAKSFKLIKGLYFLQFKNTPEFLQAEAEDLSLMTAGPKPSAAAAPPTSSSAGAAVPKRASQLASFGVPLVAADVVSHVRPQLGQHQQRWMMLWMLSRRGYEKDCPYRQRDGSSQRTPKVSKVKGIPKDREAPEKTQDDVVVGNSSDTSSMPSSTSLKTTTTSVEETKGMSAGSHSSDPTSSLIDEVTVLLKTLGSMKSMKVKQINYKPSGDHQPVALLDGGATHGLRTAAGWERKDLEPVQVELALGSTWLYRHKSHRTLLSLEEVEPIVPLHRLVAMGFKIEWTSKGCRIFQPSRGVIPCSLRGGCPTMDRGDALLLLEEMEKVGGFQMVAGEFP